MNADAPTFTEEQVRTVRDAFRRDEGDIICPACRARLTVTPYAGGGTVAPVYEVECPNCGRSTYTARGH